jgi:hypothetical protein
MGTRATIKFSAPRSKDVYIYRGHDGYPENVLDDLNRVIEKSKGRWSGSEIGQLVSMFLGETYREKKRICDYEITSDFHGDEAYKYFVTYENDEWSVSNR